MRDPKISTLGRDWEELPEATFCLKSELPKPSALPAIRTASRNKDDGEHRQHVRRNDNRNGRGCSSRVSKSRRRSSSSSSSKSHTSRPIPVLL